MSTTRDLPVEILVDGTGNLRTGNPLTDRRAHRLLDRLVEQRFRIELAEWAASNSGSLRTRLGVRIEIANELLVLCQALGHWSLVPAAEIFPAEQGWEG